MHSVIVRIKSNLIKPNNWINSYCPFCYSFKLAAVGLACLAFVFSIVLLGLASAGIDFFRSVPASFLNAGNLIVPYFGRNVST